MSCRSAVSNTYRLSTDGFGFKRGQLNFQKGPVGMERGQQPSRLDSRSRSVLQCDYAPLARQDREGRDVRRGLCVGFQGWPHSAPAHRPGAQGRGKEHRRLLAAIELGDPARAARSKHVTDKLAKTAGIAIFGLCVE